MARVSRGVTARARHKKVIKRAKGYYGRRKNVFRVAVQAVERGMQYACLLYTSPSPRARTRSRMPSSA